MKPLEAKSGVVLLTVQEISNLIDISARKAVDEAIARLPRRDSPRPFHVTQAQAAEILGLSKKTVGKCVRTGKLSLNDFGMIPITQLDAALGNE